jgi:hypothetical protein
MSLVPPLGNWLAYVGPVGLQIRNFGALIVGITVDASAYDFFFYKGGLYQGACADGPVRKLCRGPLSFSQEVLMWRCGSCGDVESA